LDYFCYRTPLTRPLPGGERRKIVPDFALEMTRIIWIVVIYKNFNKPYRINLLTG
jgi:hypothetical protein